MTVRVAGESARSRSLRELRPAGAVPEFVLDAPEEGAVSAGAVVVVLIATRTGSRSDSGPVFVAVRRRVGVGRGDVRTVEVRAVVVVRVRDVFETRSPDDALVF